MNLTLGRTSKNGPIHSKTKRRMTQEMSDASCVTPPTVCWINERDSDAENGMHEKNEPRMFPEPCRQLDPLKNKNISV